jgi:hypothetical protein
MKEAFLLYFWASGDLKLSNYIKMFETFSYTCKYSIERRLSGATTSENGNTGLAHFHQG